MNIKFLDLFSGLGGFRIGFEDSIKKYNLDSQCVLTSEIKKSAIKALKHNFSDINLPCDVRNLDISSIPDFDVLLAGFPCQPFSTAGNRLGFLDTRGTLFFEIERILRHKKPYGFILENVEGLLTHNLDKSVNIEYGLTFNTILNSLKSLGYKVNWKVLDAQDFGVPQKRRRIFIVGTLDTHIDLNNINTYPKKVLRDILESNINSKPNILTDKLLSKYSETALYGKSINDKRGGSNNIHSWDIELRGPISKDEKRLLELLLKERRKKSWAKDIGVPWSDGMPLNIEQIQSFYTNPNIEDILKDLVHKGYLKMSYPKNEFEVLNKDGSKKKEKLPDTSKKIGYSIPTGRLSFQFSKILNPNTITPTLVATDMIKLGVLDNNNIRELTIREALRLSGFPEYYDLEKLDITKKEAFDLIGNTVVPTIITSITDLMIPYIIEHKKDNAD